MRAIRVCRHCGEEFYDTRDVFCSYRCASQSSS